MTYPVRGQSTARRGRLKRLSARQALLFGRVHTLHLLWFRMRRDPNNSLLQDLTCLVILRKLQISEKIKTPEGFAGPACVRARLRLSNAGRPFFREPPNKRRRLLFYADGRVASGRRTPSDLPPNPNPTGVCIPPCERAHSPQRVPRPQTWYGYPPRRCPCNMTQTRWGCLLRIEWLGRKMAVPERGWGRCTSRERERKVATVLRKVQEEAQT